MLAYAQHGDFEKMHQIFEENKSELTFNLGNHWAYSRIADEYIKHGQPTEKLKSYLDIISTLKVELPEQKQKATPAEKAVRVENVASIESSKKAIIGWRNMHDQKIKVNEDIRASLTQGVRLKSHAGSRPVLMNEGVAKKGPTMAVANGSSTRHIMAIVRAPNGKVVPPKPKTSLSSSQVKQEASTVKKPGFKAPTSASPQRAPTAETSSANVEDKVEASTKSNADQSTSPKPPGYSTKLTRDPTKK